MRSGSRTLLAKIIASDFSVDYPAQTDLVFGMMTGVDRDTIYGSGPLKNAENLCRHHFASARRVVSMGRATTTFLALHRLTDHFASALPFEWRSTAVSHLESLFRTHLVDVESLKRRQDLIRGLIGNRPVLDELFSQLRINPTIEAGRDRFKALREAAHLQKEIAHTPEQIAAITPFCEFVSELGEWLSSQTQVSRETVWMGQVMHRAAREVLAVLKEPDFQFPSYSLILENPFAAKDRDYFWHRAEIMNGFLNDLCAYAALAKMSRDLRWSTFPVVVDSPQAELSIRKGISVHLYFDLTPDKAATTIDFSPEKPIVIVMGDNDSGKTTAGRTIGALLALAQVGLPVPVEAMRFTPLAIQACQSLVDMPVENQSESGGQPQAYAAVQRGMARKPGRWVQNIKTLSSVQGNIQDTQSELHVPTFVIYDEALEGSRQRLSARFASAWGLDLADRGALIYFATHNHWFTRKHPMRDRATHFTMDRETYVLRPGVRYQQSDEADLNRIKQNASLTLFDRFQSLSDWK